jgi:hypothetical protein
MFPFAAVDIRRDSMYQFYGFEPASGFVRSVMKNSLPQSARSMLLEELKSPK